MKDSFYFPHDNNAAHDHKIIKLRAKCNNAEGYGIYWMMLEMMSRQPDGILPDDFIAELCLSYGLANGSAIAVLEAAVEIGLFIKDRRGIFSKRMVEHKSFREERSASGKKGAANRWPDSQSNTKKISHKLSHELANGSAISSANAKERKGKESNIEGDFLKKNKSAVEYLKSKQ